MGTMVPPGAVSTQQIVCQKNSLMDFIDRYFVTVCTFWIPAFVNVLGRVIYNKFNWVGTTQVLFQNMFLNVFFFPGLACHNFDSVHLRLPGGFYHFDCFVQCQTQNPFTSTAVPRLAVRHRNGRVRFY